MKPSLFSVSFAGDRDQHRLDVSALIAKPAELGNDSIMLAGKKLGKN